MKKPFAVYGLLIMLLLSLPITVTAHIADQKPMQLSKEQREAFDTFFSNFSEAYVQGFSYGQITDDQLIQFGVRHLRLNDKTIIKRKNSHYAISSEDVDWATKKYFGKVVQNHHSISRYTLVDGYYEFDGSAGDVYFSKIGNLYDNGDGTFTASVYMYAGDVPREQFLGLYDNGNGTYTARGMRSDGGIWETPNVWLINEYKATIAPVYEEGVQRYILLEYLQNCHFNINRGYYETPIPNPLPKD